MGVYYIIVNDSKKEYIDPINFNDNCKLNGIFRGTHASGVVDLLLECDGTEKYKTGYWSGDNIRVLGDHYEEEYERVCADYENISYFILANIYEFGALREKIVEMFMNDREMLTGLIKANEKFKYLNLNHKLKTLELI